MCKLGNGGWGKLGKIDPEGPMGVHEVKGQVVIPGANKEMPAGRD